MNPRSLIAGVVAAAVSLSCGGPAADAPAASGADLEALARGIHERVITLDTHVDINPGNFTPERSYANRLDTQVDVTKMEEGGLDAVFLIVFVGQDDDLTSAGFARATAAAMDKFDAIHRLTDELAPDRIGLALTSEDARRLDSSGKKIAFIGVENGYQLGDDISNVRKFAELGARYLSVAHNGHSQLADSNTGERDGVWMHDGLSPLGRQVVQELNKWGIMVDISHPSKQSMMQILEMTEAPIIASHSAVRAICDHSRNLDDEQLLALAENGGVMQTVAFNTYVKCQTPSPERASALAALETEQDAAGGRRGMTDQQRAEFRARRDAIDAEFPPPPRATVAEFVDHIDYAGELIGIDHVGISSDFDGGGVVDGWMDATETFNVTMELVRRGYTEDQIGQLWSGNLPRVLDEVQEVSRRVREAETDQGD